VWRGYHVDLAWRLGEEGGPWGRRLHLELKGFDLLFIERGRQGDDEWECDEQKAQHDLEALGFGVLKSENEVCVGRQAGG
jgi:hypothetical protein